MNIRLLTLSAVTSSILIAATPMVPTSMSTDNGGTKSAIDAYSDGGGVVIINQAGDTKFDNSAMNGLVFKYGETAKSSNTTLKNQISVLSADATAAEKAISIKFDLAKVVINPPANGTACDDGNPQTLPDVWNNGLCNGANVEGQSCDDGVASTYLDKYLNGTCLGVVATSCKSIHTLNTSLQNGTYSIDIDGSGGMSPINVYCDMVTDGGGWTLFGSNGNALLGDCASTGAINCGTVSPGTVGTMDIRNITFSDIMAQQNINSGSTKYLIYKNIANINTLKSEWADTHISASLAQTVFGSATVLGYDGVTSFSNNITAGIVEVHHYAWLQPNGANWILSNQARPSGAGLTNNFEITSHGAYMSINGVAHSPSGGYGVFFR